MKALLINPPTSEKETYSVFSFAAPCLPPLGLAYLAAVLRKEHEIKIVDGVAEKLSLEEIGKIIGKFSPDILGVGSTTISYMRAREVIKLAKSIDSSITTVMGGPHTSALPEQSLQETPELDIICIGEGEETTIELFEVLAKGKAANGSGPNHSGLDKVKGIAYRKNRQIKVNPRRPPIADLDTIPIPARDLLSDMKNYFHTPMRGTKATANIISSRGCPFNCHYCDQTIFGRSWRAHSADYVVNEVRHLKEKYGIDYISFEDDNFALEKKRVNEICDRLISEKLDIKWGCSIRVDSVTDEIIKKMKKAGCWNIYIGVESGSQEMLDFVNKRITIDQIRRAVSIMKHNHISVYGSFILALPKETRESMAKTVNLACSLPLDGVSFNIFTPYPNTYLREIAPKYGKVDDKWENYSDHAVNAPFVPNGFTQPEIIRAQRDAYKKFYLRPSFALRHIPMFMSPGMIKNALRGLKVFFS